MILLSEGMKDNLGKCYQLSWQWVSTHRDYKLAHGYITKRGTDICIDHAWTEIGDTVYDPVMEKSFPKQVYFALMQAEEAKVYTAAEAMKMGASTGVYGPWHKIPAGKVNFHA